jgi:XTP/dITP diphosphohydrolase
LTEIAVPEILLATSNPGKLREMREITAAWPLVWRGRAEFPGLPEADESGATFAANARLKALHYARLTGLDTLADDSGLEVDALAGQPGVHSARYAGVPRDDGANNRKLVHQLAGVPLEKRVARFHCSMALACNGQVMLETTGTFAGLIIDEPRGTNGFGYDPHFLVPDLGLTVAELPAEQKHTRSHRGEALRAMLTQMEALYSSRGEWDACARG